MKSVLVILSVLAAGALAAPAPAPVVHEEQPSDCISKCKFRHACEAGSSAHQLSWYVRHPVPSAFSTKLQLRDETTVTLLIFVV